MSNFREIKELALIRGAINPASLRALDIPARIIKRWERLLGAEPLPAPKISKYINHFQIGADPEFGIMSLDGEYIPPTAMHLDTGSAYGADLNGRIAELRCKSSKSAFDVVASTLGTLRWFRVHAMKYGFSKTRIYAGPFFLRDGLGGHVHFGRKRTVLRAREIAALNILARIIQHHIPIFDRTGIQQRNDGPGHYGDYGDVRPQLHGYEYRTLPTWLRTPWLAMLVLTLSKLFVARPEIADELANIIPYVTTAMFQRLITIYQNQDEDIRICAHALRNYGWPAPNRNIIEEDSWGLGNIRADHPTYIPSVISPSKLDRDDLHEYLVAKVKIPTRVDEPTWTPTKIDKAYTLLTHTTTTVQHKQVGEIVHGLATYMDIPTHISINNNRETSLLVNAKYLKGKLRKARSYFPKCVDIIPNTKIAGIQISLGLRTKNSWTPMIRRFLTSGMFNIWDVRKLPPPKKILPKKDSGMILFNSREEI